MRNNSCFVLLFMEVYKLEGEWENGEEKEITEKESIFTNLWTLSHLLTFSYDVVCHNNKRWVSLRFRIKRRNVLFKKKNAIMPWNDTLKDAVVVMQHATVYCRQTVKQYVSQCDPADITNTFKKCLNPKKVSFQLKGRTRRRRRILIPHICMLSINPEPGDLA